MANWNKNIKWSEEQKADFEKWIKAFEEGPGNVRKGFKIPFKIDEPDPDFYINEEGNEIPLENWDKGKNVTLEVPFTSIGFSAAGSKEKEPQHYSLKAESGSYSLKGNNADLLEGKTLTENGTFTLTPEDLETSKALVENCPTWLDLKLHSICRLLPKGYSEVFKGDLIEIRSDLTKEGHSEKWIDFILASKVALALVIAFWNQFKEFVILLKIILS